MISQPSGFALRQIQPISGALCSRIANSPAERHRTVATKTGTEPKPARGNKAQHVLSQSPRLGLGGAVGARAMPVAAPKSPPRGAEIDWRAGDIG